MNRQLPPIMCSVDDRYVRPLLVLLESLAAVPENTGMRMLMIHTGLTRANSDMVERHTGRLGIEIGLHRVKATTGGPVSGWVSDAVYLRLEIGDTLADQVGKVLYLDADTLLLGRNVAQHFEARTPRLRSRYANCGS